MEVLLHTIVPHELTNGNEGRGTSWYKPAIVRKKIEKDLRATNLERDPFDCLVDVTITRILGPRQSKWDADSVLRGSAKELIDALVAVGWFVDDGPRWIRHCDGRQDDTRRACGPAVEITVTEVT